MFTFPTTLFAGGVSFVPTDVSDCLAWVDASDASTVTVVGGSGNDQYEVTAWADKSGNGHDFAPTGVGYRPEYGDYTTQVADGSDPWLHSPVPTVNGLATMHFDATSFVKSAALGRTSEARSWFLVTKQTSVFGDGGDILTQKFPHMPGTTAGDALNNWINQGGSNVIYKQSNAEFKSSVEDTNVHMYSTGKVGPASSTISLYRDSTTANDTGTDTTSYANADYVNLGALYSTFASYGFEGLMCEFITYDQNVSTADRATITEYLKDKWGIS